MGTMIALFLVLSTLSGCANETLTNLKNAPPILAAAPAVFTYQAELTRCEGAVSGDDGTVLAEYAYEVPLLKVCQAGGTLLETASDPEESKALAAAQTFNDQFLSWVEPDLTGLTEIAQEEQSFRAEEGLSFIPYQDELSCTVYQTEQLISVFATYCTYTGGAHPNTILLSWNFDLESGEFFEPEILDEGGDLREYVQSAMARQVREEKLQDLYWEDYETTLADWSNYAVSFDETGMTVAFSPYELAAYAAGPQIFRLSYEELLPHLGPHGRALLGLEDGEGESSGN